jgi:serine/threonine protein kinase/sugar lactone lactonase YvrE
MNNDTGYWTETASEVGAEFLREWHAAEEGKRSAVLESFCAQHPDRSEEFRMLVEVRRLVSLGAPDSPEEEPRPERFGPFRVIRELPRGGMGRIFEAIQEPLGRRVAVKTIRGDLWRVSPEVEAKFLNEQQVLARLHHTHIVPIFAASQEGDLRYFAMPFIRGASLARLVRAASDLASSGSSSETPSLAELAKSVAPGCDGPTQRTVGTVERAPATVTVPFERERELRSDLREGRKRPLSRAYVRSVAKVIAAAADALEHAHAAKVIHRDVKPSNLMVDAAEHCWVIDFGLASMRNGRLGADGSSTGDSTGVRDGATHEGGGTPQYMAPEQFDPSKTVDARADVWALGASLYELLAWQPAFPGKSLEEIRERVRHSEPRAIEGLVTDVPRDLRLICRKAMQKNAGERYQTAGALRDDIRRWLAREPTSVWRTPKRRAWLWSRRNPGWVAAAVLLLGGLSALLVVDHNRGVAQAQAALRERDAANEERRLETNARLRAEIDQIVSGPHSQDWRKHALERLDSIQWNRGEENTYRPSLLKISSGLAATLEKTLDFPSSGLAFDPSGRRLFSVSDQDRAIRIFDRETGTTKVSPLKGSGPIAFAPDESALLLRLPDGGTGALALIDLDRSIEGTRFAPPDPMRKQVHSAAISSDGTIVATLFRAQEAPANPPEDPPPASQSLIAVWKADTGELIHQIEQEAETRGIAVSPDGSLLAVSSEPGTVSIWTLPDGLPRARLPVCDNPIQCMAFGRDPRVPAREAPSLPRWRLAVGDVGGVATILDLTENRIRMIGRSSGLDIKAIAFNPEGTLLAAAGRTIDLFDVAGARSVLTINVADQQSAVAFKPDGRVLAVGVRPGFYSKQASVEIHELTTEPAIRSLAGLATQTARIVFSRSGKLLAALSHDWQVAVWELPSGRLLHVYQVPSFFEYTDNSCVALDEKGRRLAFASGTDAALWDIDTGRVLRRWTLPPGMGTLLFFHGPDRLTLFRWETTTGVIPFGDYASPPEKHPRVYRFYNLLDGEGSRPRSFAEHHDHNRRTYDTAMDASGRFVAVGGARQYFDGRADTVSFIVFEAESGKKLRELPRPEDSLLNPAGVGLDPTGSLLFIGQMVNNRSNNRVSFFQLPEGQWLADRHWAPLAIGPGAGRFLAGDYVEGSNTYVLYPDGFESPTVRLFEWKRSAPSGTSFAPDPRYVAWGNPDGSLSYVDLIELQETMAAHGLGW